MSENNSENPVLPAANRVDLIKKAAERLATGEVSAADETDDYNYLSEDEIKQIGEMWYATMFPDEAQSKESPISAKELEKKNTKITATSFAESAARRAVSKGEIVDLHKLDSDMKTIFRVGLTELAQDGLLQTNFSFEPNPSVMKKADGQQREAPRYAAGSTLQRSAADNARNFFGDLYDKGVRRTGGSQGGDQQS